MKKAICLISVIAILIMILPSGCDKKGINKVTISPMVEAKTEYGSKTEAAPIKPSLKPYSVRQDLSDIVNISAASTLELQDRQMLAKNLFLLKGTETAFEQPFDLYNKNIEDGIPNFITSDCVLHIYHLMYDNIIKSIENERLVDELNEFTAGSFKKAIEIYNGTKDNSVKSAAFKNICYFGIGMRILNIDLPGGIPLEANRIIDNDVKKVRARWGSGTSDIFPYSLNYKKYTTKGHYSGMTEFNNYYTAMMWYGSTPFLFETYNDDNESSKRMDEQIAMAVIIAAQTLGDEKLKNLWEDIYKVTSIYFGRQEDINLYDMSEIIKTVYGEKIDFNKVCSETKLQKVYELAAQKYKQHLKETLSGRISLSEKGCEPKAQFTLMGGICNLDTEIYDSLTSSGGVDGRDLPDGLDIPSVFGSDNALALLKQNGYEHELVEKYSGRILSLRKVLSGTDSLDQYFLNNSMDWIVSTLIKQDRSGYPSFMKSDGYVLKNIITFLGAVSDFRHLSSSVAKQGSPTKESVQVQVADGQIPGYVEPDIELYGRLEYIIKYFRSFLSANNLADSNMYIFLDNFYDTVEFLKQVSAKEIENKPLSNDESKRLVNFSSELKRLTSGTTSGKGSTRRWETVAKVDRNMASVTDVYYYENQVLQTAVGSPDYIYVVVPYDEKLYLTRGAVYSYYEFTEYNSKKLKDSDWQNLIANKETEQDVWMDSIRR